MRGTAPAIRTAAACDAVAAIRFACRLLSREALERGIALELDMCPRAMAACDERTCRQVLLNVLGNAVKHAHGATKVTLSVRPARGAISIRISDDGIGLTDEECRTLRQAYRRGASATAEGSGLGLAIVQELIDENGGSLLISRGSEGGLSVEVRLPAAADGAIPASDGMDNGRERTCR
ncbi:ATP-binding protein [Rhizobiales bacterium L72]|uniref:histidine kinase n=1 Tax=Propylenella binzhouense TaxID=2555902 RepID=A0A964WVQ3_9HYPH|nr:ATP-binding protein [Propylenella binzhouense]